MIGTTLRVIHAYKIYRPDVEGGIPEVISSLTKDPLKEIENSILVARSTGFPRKYLVDSVPVVASGSFGTLFSMPVAPFYPITLALKARSADLVVHHAPYPLTDLASVGFSKHVAFVVHWHAEIVDRAMLKSLLAPAVRQALRRADKIIVSHSVMIDQSAYLEPHREKCVAVPYGVDIAYWETLTVNQQSAVVQIRQRLPRLVVAIGRLVGYKGYSVLLKALKGLDAQLVIIGDGPLQFELKALARQLGIAENVYFVGRLNRDEIKEYLHAARVLALSSITSAEAFGIVQIEAMAAGRPVVNTSLATAVPFIARHEREGLTVAPADVEAMRSSLRRLLDDPLLAARLGLAGQTRARLEFAQELFRERNFAIYRAAVEHRQPCIKSP